MGHHECVNIHYDVKFPTVVPLLYPYTLIITETSRLRSWERALRHQGNRKRDIHPNNPTHAPNFPKYLLNPKENSLPTWYYPSYHGWNPTPFLYINLMIREYVNMVHLFERTKSFWGFDFDGGDIPMSGCKGWWGRILQVQSIISQIRLLVETGGGLYTSRCPFSNYTFIQTKQSLVVQHGQTKVPFSGEGST